MLKEKSGFLCSASACCPPAAVALLLGGLSLADEVMLAPACVGSRLSSSVKKIKTSALVCFSHIFRTSNVNCFVTFFSENTFCSGDHVSWHSPLDSSESRIQHMLLTEDPQMQPIQTPFGTVAFLQVSSDRVESDARSVTADRTTSALLGLTRSFYM